MLAQESNTRPSACKADAHTTRLPAPTCMDITQSTCNRNEKIGRLWAVAAPIFFFFFVGGASRGKMRERGGNPETC